MRILLSTIAVLFTVQASAMFGSWQAPPIGDMNKMYDNAMAAVVEFAEDEMCMMDVVTEKAGKYTMAKDSVTGNKILVKVKPNFKKGNWKVKLVVGETLCVN